MFNLEAYNEGDLLWLGEWSPTWLALLAILGAVVIGISAYDLRSLKPTRRWTLVSLRGAVYALAVLLLLEPAVDLKHVSKVKNDVAVLVDTSRTMSLTVEDSKTRYERTRRALEQIGPLQKRLAEEHEFHYYGFDSSAEASSSTALKKAKPEIGRAHV